MGALDGVWHVLNFFAPAFGMGVMAALLAKLLWWRDLQGVPSWRMASWAVLAAALASIAGLLWTGHDGKMATYGAMVITCALALWWAGWGGRRV